MAIGGLPVRANLCISPPRSSASSSPHHDPTALLTLQLTGSKRWLIWQRSSSEVPLDTAPVWRMSPSSHNVELPNGTAGARMWESLAGDVLYVRRGDPHTAVCSSEGPSAHLTFAIFAPTREDVILQGLDEILHLDEAFRADVALGETGCGAQELSLLARHLETESESGTVLDRLLATTLRRFALAHVRVAAFGGGPHLRDTSALYRGPTPFVMVGNTACFPGGELQLAENIRPSMFHWQRFGPGTDCMMLSQPQFCERATARRAGP